jgi:hypothetical protein
MAAGSSLSLPLHSYLSDPDPLLVVADDEEPCEHTVSGEADDHSLNSHPRGIHCTLKPTIDRGPGAGVRRKYRLAWSPLCAKGRLPQPPPSLRPT